MIRKLTVWCIFSCILIVMNMWSLGRATELSSDQGTYGRAFTHVTMCVDPDWEPYEEINAKGEHVGIAADLMHLISQRAGVDLELVKTADWNESIAFSKAGKCDIISFLNRTPQREKWLVFTAPYFTDPNVFITREEHDYISNPAELSGETIALPAGTSIEERLRRDYPNLKIVIVNSEYEALRMVEERKADMTLRSLSMAAYTIKKGGWFNLKVAGEISGYANLFCSGVVKEKESLRDLLNKGIVLLTPQEVREIVNRHISITVASHVDYSLVFKVLAIAFMIIVAGIVWVLFLRRLNCKLETLSIKLKEELTARRYAEEHLRIVLDTAPVYIFAKDESGKFILANKELANVVGLHPDQMVGKKASMFNIDVALVSEYDQSDASVIQQGKPIYISAERILRKDGSLGWFQVTKVPYQLPGSKNARAVLGVAIDITDRVVNEEKIKYLALHDTLTELPNRSLFFDRLQQAITRAKRDNTKLAVLFIDLDKFKPVNDTYGHDVGDMLLRDVAQRICHIIRESDTLARIGGDEFVLLLSVLDGPQAAIKVAQKILDVLREVFPLAGHSIQISASIGIAIYPEHGTTETELCKNADKAMYDAKRVCRVGYVLYSDDTMCPETP